MIKFKGAKHDFKNHSERGYHKTVVLQSYEFIKCFEDM